MHPIALSKSPILLGYSPPLTVYSTLLHLTKKTSTLTITKLAWRDLVPDTESYQELFAQPELAKEHEFILSDTQPRLHYALEQVLSPWATAPFMLLKAPEEAEYLTLLGDAVRQLKPEANAVFGGQYRIAGHDVTFEPAAQADGRFAAKGEVITANWVEAEQLFGCLRQFNGELSLQPGWYIAQMAVFSSSHCVPCSRSRCCGCV